LFAIVAFSARYWWSNRRVETVIYFRVKSANAPDVAATIQPGDPTFEAKADRRLNAVIVTSRFRDHESVVAKIQSLDARDDAPKASGTLDGRQVTFSEKRVAEGVKATVGLLESCHDESLYHADELKKARQGDHVRWVFPKPITADVMNEKIEFSELVIRLPLNTGVLWVRTGDKWRRYSKFEFQKQPPFEAWLRTAQQAE
jgi:hypothetical protein